MDFENILKEVRLISEKAFELIADGKYKESADRLEEAMFKMNKLFYLKPPENREHLIRDIKDLSRIFGVLKKYLELVLQIENEVNSIISRHVSCGSVCNRKI